MEIGITSERDYVATVDLKTRIELLKAKTGRWRAYLRDVLTPWSPRGQEGKEVIRDTYGYIISATSRDALLIELKREYPYLEWSQ